MQEVEFLPAARGEFLAAVDNYEAVSLGLGDQFLDEVTRAADRIVAFPNHGSPHLSSARRVVLPGFPFDVVYLPDTDPVVIVAIAHHRRSPGYWEGRLL